MRFNFGFVRRAVLDDMRRDLDVLTEENRRLKDALECEVNVGNKLLVRINELQQVCRNWERTVQERDAQIQRMERTIRDQLEMIKAKYQARQQLRMRKDA